VTKVDIKSPNLQTISGSFALSETMKGHQKSHLVGFSGREILGPYCKRLKCLTRSHATGFPDHGQVFVSQQARTSRFVRTSQCSSDLAAATLLPLSAAASLRPFRELKARYERSSRKTTNSQWPGKVV
jgi:hypothetical protein